ncbi:loganic acid O-methyltransferase-like [Macadamia integrifolia]|uniref:loganic acid O-methyltransferase-like n=1 Tax=Macadamia integrifolia TaxID=60698 RepID=UPI001C4EDAD5|nr:loganic acid O-methyltransferase-like [Macadamia integrifolia]
MGEMGEEEIISSKALPMKGGDGPYSYTKNSYCQRVALDNIKEMINEAIAENLDIKHLSPISNTFCIADLGCSVGPNTFTSMNDIMEATVLKYHSEGLSSNLPEFHVFFNDHTANDFNTLFTSLPPDRQYFAAGVPGSFYIRLFPKASLHFVHSSFALHYLSKLPKEITDKNSPAYNKGKISYPTSSKEVVEAYASQFSKDFESFLNFRAEELVCGGLMVLIMTGIPDGSSRFQAIGATLDVLGYCLMDMAKMGLVSEAKVDSFNFPVYSPFRREVEELLERNRCFSVERFELVTRTRDVAATDVQAVTKHARAVTEEMIKQRFGSEIIDELYERVFQKLQEFPQFLDGIFKRSTQLFVVLKRQAMD